MVFLNIFILLFILVGCSIIKSPTANEEILKYSISNKLDNYSKILTNQEDKNLSNYLSNSKNIVLLLKQNILYIKLFSFYEQSSNNIESYLHSYKNIKGVILDLRDNGGGLLAESIKILDLFIYSGVLLIRVGKENTHIHYAHKTNYSFPLVILVNSKTASASEIVAGVLQEKNRALIIGEKTFGKGSIQDIGTYHGNTFKVTTEHYYLPSGKNIDGVGITPNIELKQHKIIKVSKMYPKLKLKKINLKNKDSALLIGKIILDNYVLTQIQKDK